MDQLIVKCLPYFMIVFHFQGICTDTKLAGLELTISTYQLLGLKGMVALV